MHTTILKRREWISLAGTAAAAATIGRNGSAQDRGERPIQATDIKVLNPRERVPVGLIIDDSTCLVNLNKFAVPQFAEALGPTSHHAKLPWRAWPDEIPDAFVRKFGEWCSENGVKGKYSIVPYPACVGRLDRELPGWTRKELESSLELVRTLMMPNWDIHPEMVTHTRVIDTKTGHPYPDYTRAYMENWDWTTGRSVDEMADYLSYALKILKNVGLTCEGVTTPGGFANRARPQLAEGTFQAVRDVFGAEIPHYFRDLYSSGEQSTAPIVQNVSGLDGDNPNCVVHTLGCTGDWTGGWDCTPPTGADRFISEDGSRGRMVEVIARGDPAMMVCHWTGIYFNGLETGFQVFQEVVKRLHARFDNLIWMKLSELARYWACKELTALRVQNDSLFLKAPFACPDFTLERKSAPLKKVVYVVNEVRTELAEVDSPLKLTPNTWCRRNERLVACIALAKGDSELRFE